jgi:hypothetical protein
VFSDASPRSLQCLPSVINMRLLSHWSAYCAASDHSRSASLVSLQHYMLEPGLVEG